MPGYSMRVGEQFSNYRLKHLLGKGGYAEVYLGEHVDLGTKVAVKILNTQSKHQVLDRFIAEASALSHLENPHIVRLIEFGTRGDVPFLVMEYASKGSLRQRYPRGVTLPLSLVVSFMEQLTAALQYAHDRHLIHCDVKPDNILYGQNDEILLSDFGVAVLFLTEQGFPQIVMKGGGTLHYMAPEQLLGQPCYASDQYALGITVYEWLCGEYPFEGSPSEVVNQHLHVMPPPLHEKYPTISPAIEDVVLKALAKNPQDRFNNVRDFAQALKEACEQSINSSSDFSPEGAQEWKGKQWFSKALAYSDARSHKEAIAVYERVLKISPSNAGVYNNRGLDYYRLGEYEKAIADYEQALAIAPRFTFALHNRGNAYRAINDYQKALASYNKALEIDPSFAAAYNDRGLVYQFLGQHVKAIADYDRAIQILPSYANAFQNRGTAYRLLKQYEKALADYDYAIQLAPKNAHFYESRAILYRLLKLEANALADFKRAIELEPTLHTLYINRGLVYKALKEYEKALEDYRHVIEIRPNDFVPYFNRAGVYRDMGEFEKAEADYSSALMRATNTILKSRIYYARSLLRQELGEYQLAITDLSQAAELSSTDYRYYYNRGQIYAKLGEFEKALGDFSRVSELNPGYAQVYGEIGIMYSRLGDYLQAIHYFDRSLEINPRQIWFLTERADAYSKVNLNDSLNERNSQ